MRSAARARLRGAPDRRLMRRRAACRSPNCERARVATTATTAPGACRRRGSAGRPHRGQHPHARRRARRSSSASAEIPVRVGEVADVRIGSLTRYGASRATDRARPCRALVLGLRGANARASSPACARGWRTRAAAAARREDRGVLRPQRARRPRRRHGVAALIEPIVLVVILLLLFLGDLRAALVVAVTLPLSALATFVLMRPVRAEREPDEPGRPGHRDRHAGRRAVVVVENTREPSRAWRHPASRG
jgi:hypothetical protein